jgi:hypothetical protein
VGIQLAHISHGRNQSDHIVQDIATRMQLGKDRYRSIFVGKEDCWCFGRNSTKWQLSTFGSLLP